MLCVVMLAYTSIIFYYLKKVGVEGVYHWASFFTESTLQEEHDEIKKSFFKELCHNLEKYLVEHDDWIINSDRYFSKTSSEKCLIFKS